MMKLVIGKIHLSQFLTLRFLRLRILKIGHWSEHVLKLIYAVHDVGKITPYIATYSANSQAQTHFTCFHNFHFGITWTTYDTYCRQCYLAQTMANITGAIKVSSLGGFQDYFYSGRTHHRFHIQLILHFAKPKDVSF